MKVELDLKGAGLKLREKEVSLVECERITGIHRSRLSKMFRPKKSGVTNISLTEAIRIARVLEMSVEELFLKNGGK